MTLSFSIDRQIVTPTLCRGGRGGGGGGGGRGPLPRNVQVSKKISWLLRHGAESEGLKLDAGGYLNCQEVLGNRKIRSLQVTFDELRAIVEDNDKQRFTMTPVNPPIDSGEVESQPPIPSNKPHDYLIRANQGHSLAVETEGLLTPITAENAPTTAVHGTTHAAWPLILASAGLKAMTRNHVHFASGLPSGFTSLATDADGAPATAVEAPVISGMRKSSTVLMFLDVGKAMEAGLKLWRSDNGVILTDGDAEGLVPLELFRRVEDRTGQGVLLEEGKVVKEAPASWAGKGKGRGKG
ncbi:tRNA 2'-phosphotransferase [Teratosphaeriaceae sp. CCFEE 6253]|nr:tRNA 2'-phosphotransferase [Teratosphaeriaceae sp. CCFEE 6253]